MRKSTDPHRCQFKIYSGAGHSLIPSKILQTVLKDAHLKSTDKIIFSPNRTPLKLIGELVENIEYNRKNCLEDIFAIKGLETCLLGKPAIIVFRLGPNIQPHCLQIISSFDPIKEFPRLFKKLRLLKRNYHIKFIDDAKPYSPISARSIPIPLLEKTRAEINRMLELNVIKPE